MAALALAAAPPPNASAQRGRGHSAAHFAFRARAERSDAYPLHYARAHLPHLHDLWFANRDGSLQFQASFRDLFTATGAAVLAQTPWTELDPRFFFGFFADKHYTEDTGSCDDTRGPRTSSFREVGIFNIPAGPPVLCENTEQFAMIFGDYLGARARPSTEYRRERRRLCDAHHARDAELRRSLGGVSDPFALMRARVQRGPEYLGCSLQPSPALLPSQEDGYNVFYDLAVRAATPGAGERPLDARLIEGIRRGVGLPVSHGVYAFDLGDDAWKRTDLRHMGEQFVLGFVMLDQDAAAAPRDDVAPRSGEPAPLWAQYWRAVQAVFAWSAGSGQVERLRSRASVQAALAPTLAAWRADAPPPLPRMTSRTAEVTRPPPLERRGALVARVSTPLDDGGQVLAPRGSEGAPRPTPWDALATDRLRRPVRDGREVPPPYLALYRGLCAEYFDRCAGELRALRRGGPRDPALRDEHRYVRCSAVAPPHGSDARQTHPYYRLLRLAHRIESSRTFLESIGAHATLRAMDVLVGTVAELTPAYRVITAAATGGTVRVDDVSLEGMCGAPR
ncbi:MAG: hypothetical protein U0325_13615 [Polyangiales bacterium]